MSSLFGVIEGFYGRQWSWHQRHELVHLLPQLQCDAYLYAPKADVYLRRRWREDWPAEEWQHLLKLAKTARQNGVSFGVGLSVLDYTADDQPVLANKIARLNELELGHLGVFFDDMRGDDPSLLDRQLAALSWIRQCSNAQHIIFCPTYYSTDPVLEQVFGAMPEDYWSRLAVELPSDVRCFWTGPRVCSESIYAEDVFQANAILGRPPTIWDNYPVNDGRLTSNYLHLRPASGRSFESRQVAGFFINPMNQFELSLPVIAAARSALVNDEQANVVCEAFAFQRWGEEFTHFWLKYRDMAQDLGLDNITLEDRQNMLDHLSKLEISPAKEWRDWLLGEYTFDPDCLT